MGNIFRPVAFVLNLVLVAVLTLSCTVTSITTPATTGDAKVVKVIDGDTIDVSISGTIYRVRYIGIDTPEIGEPFYQEATNKNSEFVGGKTVKLERDVSETDKYGRLLRYVYVGDLFVNAELVRSGYARAITYQPDVRYQVFLESIEQ